MNLIRNKFDENAGWRLLFYVVCTLGIIAASQVIANPDMGLKWIIVLGMLVYVYLAIDLLWWFGDHPEE